MRNFPARPKGTLIYGTFRSGSEAERALRVLKNAGYARAEVVADVEAVAGAPILLVVDAATTAAFRAAEILEEHGADVRYDSESPSAALAEPTATQPASATSPPADAALALPPLADRKPRVRKRSRLVTQAGNAPLDGADVVIVTRGIESIGSFAP